MLQAKTKEELIARPDARPLLYELAEDAFDVLNWARREGMKKDRQLAEVVSAFEKTLLDRKAKLEVGSQSQ